MRGNVEVYRVKRATATLLCIMSLPPAACVPTLTPQQQAAIQQSAARTITCQAGSDCEVKWSHIVRWLNINSEYKIQTITDSFIQTFGPVDDATWAFNVTKVAEGGGIYTIDVKMLCGTPIGCYPKESVVRASLNDAILGRLVPDGAPGSYSRIQW